MAAPLVFDFRAEVEGPIVGLIERSKRDCILSRAGAIARSIGIRHGGRQDKRADHYRMALTDSLPCPSVLHVTKRHIVSEDCAFVEVRQAAIRHSPSRERTRDMVNPFGDGPLRILTYIHGRLSLSFRRRSLYPCAV
jgi:hypothetical protein